MGRETDLAPGYNYTDDPFRGVVLVHLTMVVTEAEIFHLLQAT